MTNLEKLKKWVKKHDIELIATASGIVGMIIGDIIVLKLDKRWGSE